MKLVIEPQWLFALLEKEEFNKFVPSELQVTEQNEWERLMMKSIDEVNMETFERVRLIDEKYWTAFAKDCVMKAIYSNAAYNVANEILKYQATFTKIDKLGDFLKQFATPLEQGLKNVQTYQRFFSNEAKNYLTRCGLNYRGNVSIEYFISRWSN